MSSGHKRRFEENGATIYCVEGHGTVRRSDIARLRAELAEAQEHTTKAETALHNEKQVHAATFLRDGVCPQCNRRVVRFTRQVEADGCKVSTHTPFR